MLWTECLSWWRIPTRPARLRAQRPNHWSRGWAVLCSAALCCADEKSERDFEQRVAFVWSRRKGSEWNQCVLASVAPANLIGRRFSASAAKAFGFIIWCLAKDAFKPCSESQSQWSTDFLWNQRVPFEMTGFCSNQRVLLNQTIRFQLPGFNSRSTDGTYCMIQWWYSKQW